MCIKVYGLIWAFGIIAVAITYLTGNFTPTMNVVFGFLSFGLIFMGILSVLPMMVEEEHHAERNH